MFGYVYFEWLTLYDHRICRNSQYLDIIGETFIKVNILLLNIVL